MGRGSGDVTPEERFEREQKAREYHGKESKPCAQCKQELLFTEFYAHKKSKDGLQWNCKKCHNEIRKRGKQGIEKRNEKVEIKPEESIMEREKVKDTLVNIMSTNMNDFFYHDDKFVRLRPVDKLPNTFPYFVKKLKVGVKGDINTIEMDNSFQMKLLEKLGIDKGIIPADEQKQQNPANAVQINIGEELEQGRKRVENFEKERRHKQEK